MKFLTGFFILTSMASLHAQVWKVLPKGVRIVGYRNVTTSKIEANYNQSGAQSPLGTQFRIDANTFNAFTNNLIATNISPDAYQELMAGEYKVDAEAQINAQGTGFGYGITNKLMLYGEIAHYKAEVKANIKRTAGNTYERASRLDPEWGDTLRQLVDVDEATIQSVVTNYYNYKPIGTWHGSGFGDMETGFMYKAIDKGVWGLMLYPGAVLPTGRQDDPDMLQDIGFGDGQYDFFGEAATGYVVNDHLHFGTIFRYTYQAPSSKTLRIPEERDFTLSNRKGNFDFKPGDKINWTLNSTISLTDWIAFTPIYRFMYQQSSNYSSEFSEANKFLEYNSDRQEHQGQITTTFSSVKSFLKNEFLLPAQINVNYVKTLSGKNVPVASRFEVEFRMLF